MELGRGRTVVNWREVEWKPYPSLPESGVPIYWHPIRANPDTGEGFYLVKFPPGASSSLHEHTGAEHFTVLEGELTDPDGTTYRTGDCVALEPGTRHASHSATGCIVVAFIAGPLRTLD